LTASGTISSSGQRTIRLYQSGKKFLSILTSRDLSIVTSGVLFRTIAALLFAKVSAALLGPVEYATYGHFYMVMSFLVTGSSFGLGNAFTVYIARNSATEDTSNDSAGAVMTVGSMAGMVVAVLMLGLFLIDRGGVLLPPVKGWNLGWWLGFCVICAAATSIQSVLLGKEKHAQYQLVTALNPVVSCAMLVAATAFIRINPTIAILAYMLGFVVPLARYPSMIAAIRPIRFSALVPLLRFSLPYLMPGLLVPTLGTISTLSVRHMIAVNVSTYDLGLWQALWRLSEGYMGALTSVGTVLFLPRFSRIVTRRDAWKNLTRAATMLVGMYVPLAVCFLAIPRILLSVLLSGQFTTISTLLPVQIVGDLLKIICFVLELFFICMLWPRLALLGEILFSAFFLGASFLIVTHVHTPLGAVMGYSLSYSLVLCILVPLVRRRIRSLPA
jgi:O-antigen/teichoic acid export membrane protein